MSSQKCLTGLLALAYSTSLMLGAETKVEPKKTPKAATQPKTISATPASDADSPLVRAAKSAPQKREKATIKIDNAAVKKNRGKVSSAPPLPMPKVPYEQTSGAVIARHDRDLAQWKKDSTSLQEKVDLLTREVQELEQALGRYEEDFYNEDDPGYRDSLEGKYDSTDQRLKKAREELAAALQEANEMEKNKPRLY